MTTENIPRVLRHNSRLTERFVGINSRKSIRDLEIFHRKKEDMVCHSSQAQASHFCFSFPFDLNHQSGIYPVDIREVNHVLLSECCSILRVLLPSLCARGECLNFSCRIEQKSPRSPSSVSCAPPFALIVHGHCSHQVPTNRDHSDWKPQFLPLRRFTLNHRIADDLSLTQWPISPTAEFTVWQGFW